MYGDNGEPQENVKLPPHDLDAEEAVLGSLLIDTEAMAKIAGWLHAQDFYREKNRWTYEACVDLHRRGEPTNQIIIAHEMARRQRLEPAGGAAYLSHLVSQVPTAVHVEYYAQIVQRLAVMRKLITAGNQIAAIGYEQPPDVDEALSRAEAILAKLRADMAPSRFNKGIDLSRVTRE